MNDVCADHEPALLTRQRGKAVALISLQDYNAIMETMHLQSSPTNVQRLVESMAQLRTQKTKMRRRLNWDGVMLKSVDSACNGAAV